MICNVRCLYALISKSIQCMQINYTYVINKNITLDLCDRSIDLNINNYGC